MNFVDIVALVAVLQPMVFGVVVGRGRTLRRQGTGHPVVVGHERFGRAYRVPMITLEGTVLFLPTLCLAARHGPPALAAEVGRVHLAGHMLGWRARMRAPARRGPGLPVGIAPILVLLLAAVVGAMLARLH